MQVVVVTEDTGMLAKARHDNLAAIRVRELPTSRAGVAEMLLDRDLLSKLEPPNGHGNANPRQQGPGGQANHLSSGNPTFSLRRGLSDGKGEFLGNITLKLAL